VSPAPGRRYGLPTLADPGYDGAGIGVHIPVRQPADGQTRAPRRPSRVAGYQHAIHHRPTTTNPGGCVPYAANLAWISYLNRPCGMAGVTLVEASRELPCNGEKHVSASAAVPGMARTGPPRSTGSSRSAQPGLEPAMQRRHRVR